MTSLPLRAQQLVRLFPYLVIGALQGSTVHRLNRANCTSSQPNRSQVTDCFTCSTLAGCHASMECLRDFTVSLVLVRHQHPAGSVALFRDLHERDDNRLPPCTR